MKINKMNGMVISISILIALILLGSFYIKAYRENVNYVVNYNIFVNLDTTKSALNTIDNKLAYYDNKQLGLQEFNNILTEDLYTLWGSAYTTKKYKHIDKNYEYVDIHLLEQYIVRLKETPLSDQELEYHKKNIQKICNLWSTMVIEISDDFIKPTPEIIETLKETNLLSKNGLNRLKGETIS